MKHIASESNGASTRRFARNFHKSRWLLMVLGAALCVTAITAFAKEFKHVQGSGDGTFTITPGVNDAAPFAIHFSGTGRATHIGRIEFVLDSLSTLDSAGNPVRVPGTTHGNMTTSNGDQIFFTLTWIGTTDGDQVHSGGALTLQGGTGRFARVIGSGEFNVLANLSTHEMSATFDGTFATK